LPVANWARNDQNLRQRLFSLCERPLSPTQRLLLSAIVNALGTGEALLAGIGLLNERQSPNITYDLAKGLESFFLERCPYGDTSNAFVYAPRRADEIRAKLFRMVLSDQDRRRIAFSTLGQIEVWRIEYGRPDNEPHHPMIESNPADPGRLLPSYNKTSFRHSRSRVRRCQTGLS
jgi:NACHT C-terminal Alpha/Beta 2